MMQSEYRIRYTAEQLDDALKNGAISEEMYNANIESARLFSKRMSDVNSMLNEGAYIFSRSPSDLKEDFELRLINQDVFNAASWFGTLNLRNHGDCGIISVKLRFSLMGLKVGGRYDTFEYILDTEDSQISDRRYCVHGTLFEGCGNYRAPDSADIRTVSPRITKHIVDLISCLIEDGSLKKDYVGAEGFDCTFFDLYVRTEEGSIHTKGTDTYPLFLRCIMLMMCATDS